MFQKPYAFFSGQNTVAVGTAYEIASRVIGFGPLAILYDKNNFNLQVQSHTYIFPAVLCEHGKIITHIPLYTYIDPFHPPGFIVSLKPRSVI